MGKNRKERGREGVRKGWRKQGREEQSLFSGSFLPSRAPGASERWERIGDELTGEDDGYMPNLSVEHGMGI